MGGKGQPERGDAPGRRAGKPVLPLRRRGRGKLRGHPGGDAGGGAAGRGGADAALLRGAGLRPVLRAGRKGVVFLQPGGAGALVLPGVDLQGGGKAGAVSALHHGGQPGAVRQGAGAV